MLQVLGWLLFLVASAGVAIVMWRRGRHLLVALLCGISIGWVLLSAWALVTVPWGVRVEVSSDETGYLLGPPFTLLFSLAPWVLTMLPMTVGAAIAEKRNRSPFLGAALGLLLSWVGVLLLLLVTQPASRADLEAK